MAPRLLMTGISKGFGGVPVLRDVGLRVEAGEIVALLGANGAGKSTLMKVLAGLYPRDAGRVEIDGAPAEIATPRDAARAGIRLLPQEVSVMPDMTVAENVCLPVLGDLGGGPWLPARAMRARAAEVLGSLGFGHLDPDWPLRRLGAAERRMVEVARALAARARVLVMDEPTAALPEADARLLFDALRRLRSQGVAVVYISHYLREVFAVADRIEVLRDGRNAGSFETAETDVDAVLAAMLGRQAGHLFEGRAAPDPGAPVALAVEGLSWRGRLRDVSLTLRQGEILGAFGLVGSGVENLGRVLFGAEGVPDAGRVEVGGRPYRPRTPAQGKGAGLGLVTAERKADGLLPEMSVAENLAAPFWRDHGWGPWASPRREAALARRWIDALGIRAQGPGQPIRLLSGGNQQKVCLARWLHPAVRVLILEEPTRGVDVGARADIYRQVAGFAKGGLAVLVLSSDAEEVAGLAHRSLVLDRGRVARRFEGPAEAGALLAATGAATRQADGASA